MPEYTLGLYEKAIPAGLPFREMLEITSRCGFDRFEISLDESDARLSRLDWSSVQIKELARLSADLNVPIRTMCLSGHRRFPLGSHDPAVRQRSLGIMRRAIEFSAALGVVIIQLAGYDVYYEEGDQSTRAFFAENLALSLEYAARYGVMLGFETMETPFMDTVAKAMEFVSLINSPYLGVYPDIGNLKNASLVYGTDLLADISTGSGHIMAAHLKETNPGVYRDMRFGSGHTEYQAPLQLLWRMGVRMYTGEFWYDGSDNAEEVIREASVFLRNQINSAALSA